MSAVENRACLPKDHPLVKKKTVKLAELAKEPFLLLEEGIYSEIEDAFRKERLEPQVLMTVHDDYSILSMVEQGLGVTILPKLVLKKQNYDIVMLPTDPPVIRRIGIITQDKNRLSIAARLFINMLVRMQDDLP